MPQRVQLSRAAGWRKPAGCIVVSRPSRWGNPYVASQLTVSVQGPQLGTAGYYEATRTFHADLTIDHPVTPAMVVEMYRLELVVNLTADGDDDAPFELRNALDELRGYDLGCWCPLTYAGGSRHPCHADVLLEFANWTGRPPWDAAAV